MINLPSTKTVSVLLPTLYRYLNKEYLDLFFEKGIMRISSLNRFKNYDDEIRGDVNEGTGSMISKTQDADIYVSAKTLPENNDYILSTSLIYDEEIMRTFKTDSCLKIVRPLEFSLAILNSIPGSIGMHIGFCNYQNTRTIDLMLPNFTKSDFLDGPLFSFTQPSKPMIEQDPMKLKFLKESKYQNQFEFRLLWSIDDRYFAMAEYLDIECKEAILYCEKI